MIEITLALLAAFQLAAPGGGRALVSYPTLGYALSERKLMRIAGVPGACYSAPEADSVEYLQSQTASAARAVLLSTGGNAPALIYRTPNSDFNIKLDGSATDISISPTGAYFAALTASKIQVYGRSNATPVFAAESSALPIAVSEVSGLLVGDSGDVVLETPTAFWYSAGAAVSAPQFTRVAMEARFLRFAPRDHLLAAYDAGQGRVVAIHPTAGFAVEPLIGADALAEVTGIEFGDGPLSIWISQRDGALLQYNLLQRQLTNYPVGAGSIASVLAPGVFRWLGPGQQLSLLDTTRSAPSVLIVPAGEPALSK